MRTLFKLIFNVCFGTKQKRYDSIHTLMSVIAIRLGYRMGNRNLYWYNDKEFQEIYLDLTKNDNKKKRIPERKYVLYGIAKSISSIKGDIVECGVYRGQSSFLMLQANKDNNKKFYGFDSFEGLSQPEEIDKVKNNFSYSWKKNDLSVPQQIAEKNLMDFKNRYKLFKGWIPDRFNEVANKRFSLVHIDVDLYQPTFDSISFFWERLNIGGALVCDDYGSLLCPGAKKAMDNFFEPKGISIIHLTNGQGLVFKQNN